MPQRQTFRAPEPTAQWADRREWRLTYKCKGAPAASARTVVVVL